MEAVLREAWDNLQRQSSEHITTEDIVNQCERVDGEDSSTVGALCWRLHDALSHDISPPLTVWGSRTSWPPAR
jgi:hypothetical protein